MNQVSRTDGSASRPVRASPELARGLTCYVIGCVRAFDGGVRGMSINADIEWIRKFSGQLGMSSISKAVSVFMDILTERISSTQFRRFCVIK